MNIKSHFLIWNLIFSNFPVEGLSEEARPHLFPKPDEQNDQDKFQDHFAYQLRPCFKDLRNGRYPSGYARLKAVKGQKSLNLQLERSTFYDPFIESCVTSVAQNFQKEGHRGGSWTYAHIISVCQESSGEARKKSMECQVKALLNDFSENKETSAIIEKHWKESKENPHPYRAVLDLYLALKSLSKK